MDRIAAGLLVALTVTGCQPSDAPPADSDGNNAAVYGAAAGNVRAGQVTARLEQLLWDQRPPPYVRSGLWHLVRASYDRRRYQPYWVGAGAPERAAALVGAVCRAEEEGLRRSDYQLERIESELEALRRYRSSDRLAELDLLLTGVLFAYGRDLLLGRVTPGSITPDWNAGASQAAADQRLQLALTGLGSLDSAVASLRPQSPGYEMLIGELASLRAAAAAGGWAEIPDDAILRSGARGSAVDALRRRLAATADLSPADTAPNRRFDGALRSAVARFQSRHGLVSDGVAGSGTIAAMNVPVERRIAQVEANLERYRWVPENLLTRFALVHVSAARLTLVSGDSVTEMAARVPRADRAGMPPMLADTISTVVMHPWPDSSVSRKGPARILMRLAHANRLQLQGNGRAAEPRVTGREASPAVIMVERPLQLAALATGRSEEELRLARDADPPTRLELPAALPVFMLDPTVRREGDAVRFAAAVSARDQEIATALGPADPVPASRCEALALAAASAVLSAN